MLICSGILSNVKLEQAAASRTPGCCVCCSQLSKFSSCTRVAGTHSVCAIEMALGRQEQAAVLQNLQCVMQAASGRLVAVSLRD